MSDTLTIATLLLLAGLGLILGEILIAATGLASFLAASCLLASVALAFIYDGPVWGATYLTLALLGAPVSLGLAVWLLPYTPFGRHLLAPNPSADEVLPQEGNLAIVHGLIGKLGKTETVLLPGGIVSVDGQNFDAVSMGEVIEAGQTVKVVDVQTNRLLVRVSQSELPSARPARSADDPLSRSLDELGLEPIGDPPA